jgi:hypothetical protein
MCTMSFSNKPSQCLILFLLSLVLLGSMAAPAVAADAAVAGQEQISAPAPAPLFAGFFDSVLGNRSRMIQLACIGFAIGVFILMTATRKY